MKIFTFDPELYVICDHDKTRMGFKHTGKVFYKNRLVHEDKINYYNRTWECWEYQSILRVCENWIDNNLILNHFERLSNKD